MIKRTARRIEHDHPAIAAIDASTERPPADALSWKLWEACRELAQDALNSDYIQGIAAGTLPPCSYGQYVVQDAVYCDRAAVDYETVETRAFEADYHELAAFAKARYEGYLRYNQSFRKQWHIRDVSGIDPNPAVSQYIEHEHHVAHQLPPVYGVVAMIPCEQLWAWLATELAKNKRPGNLYNFWIEDNAVWKGAYRLDNFIDGWLARHPGQYSWEQALFAYRGSMLGEVNNFRAAMSQPLLK